MALPGKEDVNHCWTHLTEEMGAPQPRQGHDWFVGLSARSVRRVLPTSGGFRTYSIFKEALPVSPWLVGWLGCPEGLW